MNMDLESLNKILKRPFGRKVVLLLHERQELAYIDLMNLLEVENTGKLNYRLKILGDLVDKNGNGRYWVVRGRKLSLAVTREIESEKPLIFAELGKNLSREC